jgi:hypothetical protein
MLSGSPPGVFGFTDLELRIDLCKFELVPFDLAIFPVFSSLDLANFLIPLCPEMGLPLVLPSLKLFLTSLSLIALILPLFLSLKTIQLELVTVGQKFLQSLRLATY